MQTIQIILNMDYVQTNLMISNKIGIGWTWSPSKPSQLLILESGSDFVAINFDVLNSYFGMNKEFINLCYYFSCKIFALDHW